MNPTPKTQIIFSLSFLLVILFNFSAQGQEKKVINSIEDVPKFTYTLDAPASEVFTDIDKFEILLAQVKADFENLNTNYQINDNTLKKSVLNTLKQIDFYEGNLDAAKSKMDAIKALEEKPSAKLLSGLINLAYISAAEKTDIDSDDFKSAFKMEMTALLKPLPWDVVQDDVEGTKGSFEIYSENLILGIIQENMDKVVEQTGKLSDDFATSLIGYRYMVNYLIPYKEEIVEVFTQYIDANFVEKKNIWPDRDIDISSEKKLENVVVAIWDSGIDTKIFKSQVYTNKKEVIDGKDNDNNGFIDDVNGIAYDIEANKTTDLLFPLDAEQQSKLPQMIDLMKGLSDLQSNINSEEATKLKTSLSQIKPEEVKPFIEELSLFGNYAHGTHVAGIAANGNPKAILMASRITFDYRMIPLCPTIELAKKEALATKEVVKYYKDNGVRIVNMSFGGNPQGIESALELNGVGKDAEERKAMAREIFDIGKAAFFEEIKNAPEILFVAAAGNSDLDAEFYEDIPSSFNLPNILTVGAVDQAGEETGFTSFGENVDVHANGFEVDSYIPGGTRMKMSGTSMSCPNVVNLAAKLMAINPKLTVAETIQLIKDGCDISADGRIVLINPKKSVELLKSK